MKTLFRLALAILLAGLSGFPGMSQIQTDSSNVPTFKTNARDVVVDVVVRKDKGSLKGLKASDFQVFENGKPQKIDFFEEHTQRKLPPAALQPLPKMPPGVYTNVPSAPAGDSVNVLLLDKLNTETADQVYVRKEMLRFLAGMKPGMRTAIFVLGSQLHFIQGFTTDSSVLLAALKDKNLDTLASKNPYFHSQSDSEDDKWNLSLLATMGGFSSQGSSAGLQAMTDALAEEANVQSAERTALTLEALQFLARYLANVPGRKNLIWFAGTFPVNIFPTRGQLLDLQNQRVYLDQVKKTADLMTASRVAVYPIEAEGVMQNHSWISPSINTHITGANGSNTDNATRGINMVNDIGAENGGHADTIFAMEQLAEATGGKAFYNTNDLSAAMQNAIEDGSSYYTLVYSPTNKKMDGKFRKIEIKVDEKGCKLAYRQGYNADETPGGTIKEPSGNLRSMMVLGLPNATQVLYGLRVTPENPQPAPDAPHAGKNEKLKGPTVRYSVDFLVRWTDVRLEQLANGNHSGKVQFEVMAYDTEGHPVNWTGGIEQMDLKPDLFKAIQASGIPGHFEIDLPKGKEVFVQTGVFDWGSRKAGTLQFAIRNPGEENQTTAHR